MFGTLGTILLVISLVLGGSGATLVAAQDSLPNQALYPVKTWSEEVRVQLAEQEQTQFQLALEFANRRGEEMQALILSGEVPPDAVQTRFKAEVDLALKLAAGKTDEEVGPALTQIRTLLQEQEQTFYALGPQANLENEAVLARTRTMLQERLGLCEDGLQDPVLLRERLRQSEKTGESEPQPNPESGFGPGPNDEPGDGGYGPGEGTSEGPGPNDEPTNGGYGPGPDGPAEEPGDGGYGPGDGTCDGDCDGTGYGPGPGDGTCDGDCDGTGYGPGPGDGTGEGPGDGDGDGICDGDCDGIGAGPDDGSGDGNPDTGGGGGDDSGSGDTGGQDGGGDSSGGDSGGGNGGGGGGK